MREIAVGAVLLVAAGSFLLIGSRKVSAKEKLTIEQVAADITDSVPEPRQKPIEKPRGRVRIASKAVRQAKEVSGSVWDRLAKCEAGGNWQTNTGNGYYGGLQFSLSTWRSVGGTGYPHEHSRETQIQMGERLQSRSGWGQWPACSRKLGLR